MSFLRAGLELLLLTGAQLAAQTFTPLTEPELLAVPAAPRLAGFAAYGQKAGWEALTPMFRAAAFRAYEKGRLPAAERWYYVYRWSQLFAEKENQFIPVWIKAMEAARVVHPNLPRRYVARKPELGRWLSPELQTWVIGNPDFSGKFFALVSPVDFLPDVLRFLDELYGRGPARFARYANLALAIALVYDLPPPPDWPHGQVKAELFPHHLPEAGFAFDWWILQDQLDRTYHRIESLGPDELKFVVDAAAPFAELEWSEKNVDLPLGALARAYTAVPYRVDRAQQDRYVWSEGSYTLPAILSTGGICIDQAYFATQVGKARAVPTLLFRGEGIDGRHAWFGFLDGNQRWDLNAGRFGEMRFVTGYARDPQTWGEISDHELQFLSERFRSTPAFHASRVHQQFAAGYLEARNYAAAIRAAWKAIKLEPRNLEAWTTVLDAQAGQGDGSKLVETTLYQAVAAFAHYPDLEALFSGRLCRSLRARGQLSAADFEEERILAKNRVTRSDLALLQAHDRLEQALATRPLAENIKTYNSLVDTLGRGAGIEFYDRIVTPFVQALLQRHEITEAQKAGVRARATLNVRPGSQLEREFNKLFETLKSKYPDQRLACVH